MHALNRNKTKSDVARHEEGRKASQKSADQGQDCVACIQAVEGGAKTNTLKMNVRSKDPKIHDGRERRLLCVALNGGEFHSTSVEILA